MIIEQSTVTVTVTW